MSAKQKEHTALNFCTPLQYCDVIGHFWDFYCFYSHPVPWFTLWAFKVCS
uniref:Uncharacterized protein n=1 Tax=Anguilla anguilla TaxID=7936 RepID=A0A0E9WJ99_ANGAN